MLYLGHKDCSRCIPKCRRKNFALIFQCSQWLQQWFVSVHTCLSTSSSVKDRFWLMKVDHKCFFYKRLLANVVIFPWIYSYGYVYLISQSPGYVLVRWLGINKPAVDCMSIYQNTVHSCACVMFLSELFELLLFLFPMVDTPTASHQR